MDEAPLPLIDDQHAASFDGTRSNKLARKAESARQARLRHKAYVTDLQEQVGALQARVRSLEPQCAPEQTAMHVVRELQSALSAEQHAQLTSWSVISPPTPHIPGRRHGPPPPSDSPPSRHQAHNVPGREPRAEARGRGSRRRRGGGRRSDRSRSLPADCDRQRPGLGVRPAFRLADGIRR